MLIAILSGFVFALFAPLIHRLIRDYSGWVIALLPIGLVAYFATFINRISTDDDLAVTYAWVSSLNINLSFFIDGLSLIMVLLISGIGALIIIYAGGYLKGHPELGRMYSFLLMFMASMLGLVLADNIITLFIFWELTSLSSYLLIGFKYNESESRYSAMQALLVTGAGGLMLMAGMILMHEVTGSWELSVMLSQGDLIKDSVLYPAIVILVLLGCFTKSAQFPFHFWLPNAMAAPTPVSAYLHSATMVKAGVYLIARFTPILGGSDLWHYTLIIIGTITMVGGAYIAWQQTDLKRILAYSTVSALGILVTMLGIETHIATEAAIVYLIVHAFYKSTLFMVAGAIDHETGTRDIRQLGGLVRLMPISAGAATLAALSMSGLPPFFGFIGKELVYEATLESHYLPLFLTTAAVITNFLTVVAAGLAVYKPFFASAPEGHGLHVHEAPISMWAGPALTGVFGLIEGLTAGIMGTLFVGPGDMAIMGEEVQVKLSFWHGLTPPLYLSLLTFASGIGFYLYRERIRRAVRFLNPLMSFGPEKGYQQLLSGLRWFSIRMTNFLQSGFLRNYILIILLSTLGLVGYTIVSQALQLQGIFQLQALYWQELVLGVVMLLATLAAITTNSRLMALASLGVVGFGVSIIFLMFGAPDLAMTQFSIETLGVILLVLVIYRLPRFVSRTGTTTRARDAIIAAAFGGLMTLFVLVIQSLPTESRLTPYFAENSYLLAGGHNVVNVILVDFRGIDTMGEITVLSVAAIGVFALLKLRLNQNEKIDDPQEEKGN